MNRRKILVLGTATLFMLGFAVASSTLLKSLSPNAKAQAALKSIDISNLKKGTYSFYPHPIHGKVGWSNDYNWSVFIYRQANGVIKVWDIPMKGKHVGMPDQRWYKPSYECENFGPTIVGGLIDESQPIKCHDSHSSPQWWQAWTWDLNGKSSSTNVDDLQQTKGSLEGNSFIFLKQKS